MRATKHAARKEVQRILGVRTAGAAIVRLSLPETHVCPLKPTATTPDRARPRQVSPGIGTRSQLVRNHVGPATTSAARTSRQPRSHCAFHPNPLIHRPFSRHREPRRGRPSLERKHQPGAVTIRVSRSAKTHRPPPRACTPACLIHFSSSASFGGEARHVAGQKRGGHAGAPAEPAAARMYPISCSVSAPSTAIG